MSGLQEIYQVAVIGQMYAKTKNKNNNLKSNWMTKTGRIEGTAAVENGTAAVNGEGEGEPIGADM